MFRHGLDPMEPQTMQHSTGAFHDTQNSDGEAEPHIEGDDGHYNAKSTGLLEGVADGHGPEDDGQLLMRK